MGHGRRPTISAMRVEIGAGGVYGTGEIRRRRSVRPNCPMTLAGGENRCSWDFSQNEGFSARAVRRRPTDQASVADVVEVGKTPG